MVEVDRSDLHSRDASGHRDTPAVLRPRRRHRLRADREGADIRPRGHVVPHREVLAILVAHLDGDARPRHVSLEPDIEEQLLAGSDGYFASQCSGDGATTKGERPLDAGRSIG